MQLGDLRAIFNSPKLLLRKIDIGFEDFKAMDILSIVTSLESVKFRCGFPPENAFNSLVVNNRSLHNVIIVIGIPAGLVETLAENATFDRVHEMTICFFKSAALESLEIRGDKSQKIRGVRSPGYFDAIQEMLHTQYRHRRVQVEISGKLFC